MNPVFRIQNPEERINPDKPAAIFARCYSGFWLLNSGFLSIDYRGIS